MDDEEERDAVFYRLEMLGYRVGQGLVERFVPPISPAKLAWLPIILFLAEADQDMEQIFQRPPPLHRHP